MKIRYSVNKWWILCEKMPGMDADAEEAELDTDAVEEYKQAVTGTRIRKELLTDSENKTEDETQSSEKENAESTVESEASKDSEKNQIVEVYDFGQYNYASSMTLGFDVVFSLKKKYSVEKEKENGESGEAVTETVSREAKVSDYLSFTLPKGLTNPEISLPDDAYYTCDTEALDSGETRIIVTFSDNVPDAESLTGKLHLTFTMDIEALNAGEGTCEFVLFEKNYRLVFGGENAIETADSADTFDVSGSIDFNESLGNIDWKDIVRPSVFSLPIQLIQHYTDNDGNDQTNTISTQDSNSSANYYLQFANDGSGGGDFTILNVPKSVTVKETTDEGTANENYSVTYYEVKVDTEKLPYYTNEAQLINFEDDISQAAVTLQLTLQGQTLTLQPTVSPEDASDNTGFVFNVSFSNPKELGGKVVSSKKIEKKYSVTAGQSEEIAVPINIKYSVTQEAADGYRLDPKYAVNDGVTTSYEENKASGTIYRDSSVTTTNYNQNKTYPFLVYWADNANKNRPAVSAENFQLQYRTVTSSDIPLGEWTDLTSMHYGDLNIDSAPTYDASTAQADNKYYYKKLPSVDKDGKTVEYRVLPVAPDGYVASTSTDAGGVQIITFEEQLNFEATLYWNDKDYSEDRPSADQVLEKLKLYRRIGASDTYAIVTDCNLIIEEESETGALDSWSVKAENLPRYDADNNEYDYVLVQGSIGDGNVITAADFANYKTHYNNARGSYGNDTSLCHNGGYITEVLQATTTFDATKVWKDSDSNAGNRPTATVTLWRYSKGTAASIDEAYKNGKAAQVIYLRHDTDQETGETVTTEHIASRALTGENIESIDFDYINLSKYDDQGREYVYFVRETLSGENKDEYETHYSVNTTDDEGNVTTTTYKNGAPVDGTITNVRRKKEAVSVTKIWRNPSGLSGIDGIFVQVEIWAKAEGSDIYEPLTIYSDTQNSYEELTGDKKTAAQTISGFTSTIAQSEKTYYVNTYNGEGKKYDMTTAKIVETVVGSDGTTKWESASPDIENGDVGTKTVTDPSGNQYSVKTKYEENALLAGGMNQYRYTQTNTITATRDYTLIKQWADNINEADFEDISSIKFTLYRRSTKDDANGIQAEYERVASDRDDGCWIVYAPENKSDRTWMLTIEDLPKYDNEGYEYYYKADEVSFVKDDGTIMTVQERADGETWGDERWTQNYYRTPDQTKVVNHIPSPGGGYFTASKIWRDNGDTDKRGDVVLRVYSKEQLKAALNSASNAYTDDSVVDLSSLEYNGTALKYYETKLKKDSDQYTAYITFDEIDREIGLSSSTTSSDISGSTDTSNGHSLKDYVVLEYEVKDVGAAQQLINVVKAVLRSITGSEDTNAAEYTYAQLRTAANSDGSYSLSGTVSNSNRQYNTKATADTGENTLIITNTRIGITSLDVNKTWEDEGNREGIRAAEIKFQLYRDGSKYTSIPESVIVTASNFERADKTTGASCAVELDRETGVITVRAADDDTANTAVKWLFTVKNLDMFSETAVPYIYNMDELAAESTSTENAAGNRQFSYIQKKQDVKSEDNNGKTQTFSFDFVNTISGTTDHVAYKYWKDASIGAGNRPDLYLTLYRCLRSDYDAAVKAAGGASSTENEGETVEDSTSAGKAQPSVDITKLESCIKYENYKDQIWTSENQNDASLDYEHGYNWKITVEDLPMFDDSGNEYIYFFTETMNNNGVTVLGTYIKSEVTKQLSDKNTYEVFTNAVTDEMRVTGRKTWSGLSNYQTTELPDPVITLYRTTASDIVDLQKKTDDQIKTLEAAGSITEVDKTFLTGSTGSAEENDKTVYAFPNTTGLDPETYKTVDNKAVEKKVSDGLFCKDSAGKVMLPKFDSEGNRYTYLVRETIPDSIASQLYISSNDNGTFSNKFKDNVNRRKITVTKNWDRTQVSEEEKENQYPSVTFTLYRYEAGTDSSRAVEIEKHTINSNEFKDIGNMESASYTFKDLLVYSPTGAQYFYYIKEAGINGYSIQYTDEESITKTENNPLLNTTVYAGSDASGKPKTITIDEDMLTSLRQNDRIDIVSLPSGWNDENAGEEDLVTNVSTTNTYVKTGTIKISGSKVWNDYHDFAGLRPASASDIGLQVVLTRSTGSEKDQNNKVDATTIDLKQLDAADSAETEPYIVWNYNAGMTDTGADKWTYTIYNLPKYAANGMPYTYTLSERTLVSGYADRASASADAGNAGDDGTVNSGDMVNRYSGSYTVRKNWYDGGNKYGLRPTDVTIVLQRASSGDLDADPGTDNGWSAFENISLEDNQVGQKTEDTWTGGYPSVVKDNDGKAIISVHLTDADVAANTNGNTWQYTFTNLPTIGKDSEGNTVKYKYRCIETQIGGIDVKTSEIDVSSAGAYTRKYESAKESEKNIKTIIGNTLSSKTELTVTKQWENDLDDYYYSRPTELTFKLQKKSSKKDSTWADVQVTGSDDNKTAYTFTIRAEDGKSETNSNGWTKTLTDLPGVEVEESTGANGETVYKQYAIIYRAVEIHTSNTSLLSRLAGSDSAVVDGAQNYVDITSYSNIPSSVRDDQDTAIANQTQTITNQLRVDDALESISVTKKWYTTSTEKQTAVFELLYKKAEDAADTWHCYADIDLPAEDSGEWSGHAQSETGGGTNTGSSDGQKQCRVKTISATPVNDYAEGSCTWSGLPKYDRDGNALIYKVVEHTVDGYSTYLTASKTRENDLYATNYTFVNVENQSYAVKKVWDIPSDAVSYAPKTNQAKFTATFKLQQKVNEDGSDWTDVQGTDITLSSAVEEVNTAKTATWSDLPKYDQNGKQLIYRAVETKVNNSNVENNTNTAYVASYQYGSGDDASDRANESLFGDTMTTVTNRMVYGFANLAKKAAYLAKDGIIADTNNGSLQGVSFDIYKLDTTNNEETLYVSGVKTDANGNLINSNGKYGTEEKYLIAGTYTLKEASAATGTGYSIWANGISFTVGSGGTFADQMPQYLGKTGEHGTAWISTSGVGSFVLGLKVQYKAAENVGGPVSSHSLTDSCAAYGTITEEYKAAYDLESRGVLSFTKVAEKSENSGKTYEDLDTHSGAAGESTAYFGVYLDEACTQQVAGMQPRATLKSATDRNADDWQIMVLTNQALNGTELCAYRNKIPYLRSNWVENTTMDYPYTLLAGTYYIKELRAPAGYRLDTIVRKAVVDELKTGSTDLKSSYVNNKAKLSAAGSVEGGSTTYQWGNNPTAVTLYKLDQFGQKVSLAEDGCLELTIKDSDAAGNSNTFPNGAKKICLYQNADQPAKWFDSNETEISNVADSYITYDSTVGSWTIKGLLAAGKTYTLEEPETSVDEDHNIAEFICFGVNADGSIDMQNTVGENATATSSDVPTAANGSETDRMNCYKSDAANNQIVMRDTTNWLKDLVLQKEDSDTKKGIANIYFKLYKYTGVDDEGEPTDAQSVLGKDAEGKDICLKTDENGRIQLSVLNAATYRNQTINDPKHEEQKLALKYGLEVGRYYLEEVEGGASDQYKLADKLYFEIEEDTGRVTAKDYNEYAKVELTGSTANDNHVSVATDAGVTTITLKNDPLHNKTLRLTKVDSADTHKKLSGAKFTLSYVSANDGHDGAVSRWNKDCITDADGILYLTDASGTATTEQPDISAKGTYTLKETKAAAGYMTRTGTDGAALTVLSFEVDTSNQIANVKCYDSMVTAEVENSTAAGSGGDHQNLVVTVKNAHTKVSAQIFSDIAKSDATKSCDQKDLTGEDLNGTHLEIYEGTAAGTEAVAKLSGDKQNRWGWTEDSGTADGTAIPAGTLKENTIYTLHESDAPIGYMAGKDIYFALSGTTIQNNETVSRIYVWIGDGTPDTNDAADTNLKDTAKWSKLTNVQDSVLTIVDEAIIAPVDLQKVLASVDSESYEALEGAVFEVAVRNMAAEGASANSLVESKIVLGTAITTEKGYLVWKSITGDGFSYGRIFNAEGTRVSAVNAATAIGKTIVLQQNAEGYVFTETQAPDTAYNNGLSFRVQITEKNYLDYRTVSGTGEAKTLTYHTDKYIDLVEAEKNTKSNIPYSVKGVSERSEKTEYKDADGLAVNRQYRSVVTLHKYDASAKGQKAAIAGTEFTLYRDSVSAENVYKKAYIVATASDSRKTTLNKTGVFTTDADGNITVEIREKGTYILKETKASTGYILDEANTLTFVLKDEAETQSLTINGESVPVYGYRTTANVLKKDENGVPNLREEVPVPPTEPETEPETQPETKSNSEDHKGTSGGSFGGGSGTSSMHAVITATEAESQYVEETAAEAGSDGTSGGDAAECDLEGNAMNANRRKNRNGHGAKTGDTQTPAIWISMICGAAAIIGGIAFFDRRRKKK